MIERHLQGIEKWILSIVNASDVEVYAGKRLLRKVLQPLPALVLYGAAMGSYRLINNPDGSFWQELLHLLFASSKLPLLIGITFVLALPSFYVFYLLAGLASDFQKVFKALIDTHTLFAITLASLIPFTLFYYYSTNDYLSAVLFNGVMFGIAAFVRQVVLRRTYRPLIQGNCRHRLLLRTWFLIYAFIGIQTGWLLRPWIGVPGSNIDYFREDTWSIAYLELAKIIFNILGL